jgi:hypothetical protein
MSVVTEAVTRHHIENACRAFWNASRGVLGEQWDDDHVFAAGPPPQTKANYRHAMRAALDALPADPAPAQEVEVAVWEGMTGLIEYVKAGSIRDQQEIFGPLWTRLGTVRLPLVKETGQ